MGPGMQFDSTGRSICSVAWSIHLKNLTNEPLRIYEGSPGRPIQREFYDATFEGGLKFKL